MVFSPRGKAPGVCILEQMLKSGRRESVQAFTFPWHQPACLRFRYNINMLLNSTPPTYPFNEYYKGVILITETY